MKFITICDTHGSLSVEKLRELEPIIKRYRRIFNSRVKRNGTR